MTKVPPSLRGDLTKWCQEIQTGVYVGNVNAKVRDALWSRVVKNIGNGTATLVYNTNNELGYQMKTTRPDKKVVDFDGIPLMMTLKENTASTVKTGFSTAYKMHQAKKYKSVRRKKASLKDIPAFVSLDIETSGLNPVDDSVISIGCLKYMHDSLSNLYLLIKQANSIPANIFQLTGLSDKEVKQKGIDLHTALTKLEDFVGDMPIIGYNLRFDLSFLEQAHRAQNITPLNNKTVDLLPIIKHKELFLDNYHLHTVLDKYGIENENPHNSLSDATATAKLAIKLIQKGYISF